MAYTEKEMEAMKVGNSGRSSGSQFGDFALNRPIPLRRAAGVFTPQDFQASIAADEMPPKPPVNPPDPPPRSSVVDEAWSVEYEPGVDSIKDDGKGRWCILTLGGSSIKITDPDLCKEAKEIKSVLINREKLKDFSLVVHRSIDGDISFEWSYTVS